MAINTGYSNYSYLNNYSYGSTSNSMYSLLNSTSSYSSSKYGVNNSTTSQNASSFIYNAKTNAENLKASLYNLLGRTGGTDTFAYTKATSSEAEVMDIKSVDSGKVTSGDDFEIQVEKMAMAQVNTGNSLTAFSKATDTGFTQGANKLNMEVGGKSYSIDFTVTANDTNQSVQHKIANAINSKNLGVKASVDYDSKTGKSALSVQSTTTGVNTAGKDNFTITGGTGKALELTGIDNVTQKAQNAEYRINKNGVTGYLRTSKSNDIDAGNGVTATIKGAGKATVKMTKDTTSQLNGVREMVNQFNGLLEAASSNSGDRRTDRLIKQLTGLTTSYANGLSKIGISTNKNGYLQINEDKMKSAAESGELEKFFKQNGSSSNFGFANRLARTAEDVSKNTTNYVSPSSVNNVNFTASQSARYNKLTNTGLLFDMFF